MKFKNFLQSDKAKHILTGIGIAIIALVIFQAGIFVGFKKASFSGRLGDNYYQTFGNRNSERGFPEMRGMDLPNTHGTIGKVAVIALPKIVVADRDGVEKTVLLNEKTDIRRFRDSIKPEELKAGDFVTIIGDPNDNGQIEARLIRVMPVPPSAPFQDKQTDNK
ncbi:MAG: hypothetical protein NTZ13_04385 [Candidatus Parcubacteria bacterium]|nr:hypothetical protein [Candidatus Parcubacteria bacterium]